MTHRCQVSPSFKWEQNRLFYWMSIKHKACLTNIECIACCYSLPRHFSSTGCDCMSLRNCFCMQEVVRKTALAHYMPLPLSSQRGQTSESVMVDLSVCLGPPYYLCVFFLPVCLHVCLHVCLYLPSYRSLNFLPVGLSACLVDCKRRGTLVRKENKREMTFDLSPFMPGPGVYWRT